MADPNTETTDTEARPPIVRLVPPAVQNEVRYSVCDTLSSTLKSLMPLSVLAEVHPEYKEIVNGLYSAAFKLAAISMTIANRLQSPHNPPTDEKQFVIAEAAGCATNVTDAAACFGNLPNGIMPANSSVITAALRCLPEQLRRVPKINSIVTNIENGNYDDATVELIALFGGLLDLSKS